MLPGPPHFEGEVHYLSVHAGGRNTVYIDGYRGQFFYDGFDTDTEQIFPDGGKIESGQSGRVEIRFASPELHRGRVHVGMPFLIREGNKVVGYGVVHSITRDELDLEKLLLKRIAQENAGEMTPEVFEDIRREVRRSIKSK